jgi:hypothetical protein
MASSHGVDTLTSTARSVQTHLRAAVVDHDPAALAVLLEGLIPLARFVGDNRIRLLVATGVLTDEDIDDYYSGNRRGAIASSRERPHKPIKRSTDPKTTSARPAAPPTTCMPAPMRSKPNATDLVQQSRGPAHR